MQHYGNCLIKCNKCGKIGHKVGSVVKGGCDGANAQRSLTFLRCGRKDIIRLIVCEEQPGGSGARGQVVSCMKVKKYVDRGNYLFVSQVVEKEPTKRRLKDVPIICEFPDVFLEDLPGLPPSRQVEFVIELVPGRSVAVRLIGFSTVRNESIGLSSCKSYRIKDYSDRVHPRGELCIVCKEEGGSFVCA
ncbi:hypothetical protein Tco_1346345 [Tanacetum coccineum]